LTVRRREAGSHNEVASGFLPNPLNAAGQRWCLIHNMWFFNNLLEEIRGSLQKGKFKELEKKYLKNFK
jgi:queuine/archaeosine tRNA-ribosyltransferase